MSFGRKGRYANHTMPAGCLYLDKKGTKWAIPDMRFVLVTETGREVRIADYWSSVGNFATIGYRHRGMRYEGFPKAPDGSETRDERAIGDAALPHVFHYRSRELPLRK